MISRRQHRTFVLACALFALLGLVFGLYTVPALIGG